MPDLNGSSLPSFCIPVPDLANIKIERSYLAHAARNFFWSLKRHLEVGICKAHFQEELHSNFRFEQLGVGKIITFTGGALAGQEFSLRVHHHGSEGAQEVGRRLESTFHNHLRPIAVIPFSHERRYGEIAYQMEFMRLDHNGIPMVRTQEPARFGVPYVLEDPIRDFHRVTTSGITHFSLVIAHLNGIRNLRKSEARLTPSSRNVSEFIADILTAHSFTLKSSLEAYGIPSVSTAPARP